MAQEQAEKKYNGLVVDHVNKIFETKTRTVEALKDINLHVRSKEFVSLLGTSGCGKSTLLRIIGGLETATDGAVMFKQNEIKGPGADRGMVFQSYTLFPWMTISENIQYGLKQKKVPKKEREEIAMHYVELVGLKGFENLYPKSLSGGMKQRVAIARALANDPDVLLLDEPFGALDTQTRGVMQELLLDVWQKSPKMVIMVTHDIDEAILLADRVVVMSARPGSVKEIIDIDIDRPRDYKVRMSKEFMDYKMHATELIREERMKLI